MPYEVRGGIALRASRLWSFIQSVRSLEQAVFGAHLNEYGSEIKGSKLLQRERFEWAKQSRPMDSQARRKHALNFLNASAQGRIPRRDEFTAYGQACLAFVDGLIDLLSEHGARLFAAMIPPVARPPGITSDLPRKDIVFLMERYYYFLDAQDETGLLVMDRTEKPSDREFAGRMERYFTDTRRGIQRAQRVVPAPFFVESDMAYGVQVADVCIYVVNWGRRFGAMDGPVREEIRDYANLLERIEWHATISRDDETFRTHSVFFVPDPYEARGGRRA